MSLANSRGHVIGCPEILTVEQLQARIRIHQSTAAMFDDNNEPGMARKFRELAEPYARELDQRRKLLLGTSNIGVVQ